MAEAYIFQGHSIDLDLQKLKGGRVRCTYFIDAKYCFEVATEWLPLDAVRADAMARARTSIRELNSMKDTGHNFAGEVINAAVEGTAAGDSKVRSIGDRGRRGDLRRVVGHTALAVSAVS